MAANEFAAIAQPKPPSSLSALDLNPRGFLMEASQIPLDDSARADEGASDDATHEVAPDLAYLRLGIVNAAFIGLPNQSGWVLIDAGVPKMAGRIARAAQERFGPDSKPAAIVLTHGHFDHVGSLLQLANLYDVPIYAHPVEFPYLNGQAAYPPPDPSVGGGMMARLSPMYPRDPIDVSRWLQPLPEDGSVPFLPGWQWILVPGHTPGQIALWRQSDRTLLPADAFITTNQESAYAVAKQEVEMHGPPMYFTQDWEAARDSVQRLAALEPELVVTGHGQAMRGPRMLEALHELARKFDEVAVPDHGRYVAAPARAIDGSAYDAPKK